MASWSWPGHEGAPVTVEVYADADEVELARQRPVARAGSRPAPSTASAPIRDDLPSRATIDAVAWRDGEELGRTSLRSASGPVRLAVSADRSDIAADPDRPRLRRDRPRRRRQASICTTADRLVQVELEGPGALQGLASANPVTEEPYIGAEQTTFDGRARRHPPDRPRRHHRHGHRGWLRSAAGPGRSSLMGLDRSL